MDLKGKLMLAPLAGINDTAFRMLCRRKGADLCFTGMVSSEALVRATGEVIEDLGYFAEDKPLAVQLFGSESDVMARAVSIIEGYCDIIDLNVGCPDSNIMKQGAGAALLKNHGRIASIVRAMRSRTKKPLTVKIRSGFSHPSADETLKLARLIQKEGADAITIHPRTAKQRYSGKADWRIIASVHASLQIPVIGNGDVKSREDIKAMQGIADSVMIGRAAMHDPSIFTMAGERAAWDLKMHLLGLLGEYLELARVYGNKLPLKQRAMQFMRGFPQSSVIRMELARMDDHEVIRWHEREFSSSQALID